MRKTAVNIETAAILLDVGRTAAYEEARGGTLDGMRVIRVGRRMSVSVHGLEERLGPLSDEVLETAIREARQTRS